MTRIGAILLAVAPLLTACQSISESIPTPPPHPLRGGAIGALVTRVAESEGVPPAIGHALVQQESGYNPRALGRAGEIGLVQIKHASARGIGCEVTREQLFQPETNLRCGFRYLRAATRGDWSCRALSRYQAGRHSDPGCTRYGRALLAKVAAASLLKEIER